MSRGDFNSGLGADSGLKGARVLDEVPGVFRVVRHKNVQVVSWVGQASVDDVVRLNKLTPVGEGAFSNVHFIASGVSLPTAEVREALLSVMKEREADIACIAVVIQHGGFWASAMRSAVTGLALLAPKSFPLRLSTSTSELMGWLPGQHAKLTGESLEPSEWLRLFAFAQQHGGAAD